MYTLTHEGEKVGTTRLERGDPSNHTVSGLFHNIGGAKALAGWIKSINGKEDDGVVFLTLGDDFTLTNEAEDTIPLVDAHLIAVPADDEVYLDISGLSEDDYRRYFAEHLSAAGED